MHAPTEETRAAVKERFGRIAFSPDQEKRFALISARKPKKRTYSSRDLAVISQSHCFGADPKRQPEPLQPKPEPLHGEPEPIHREPEPLRREPEPLRREPEPYRPKPEPEPLEGPAGVLTSRGWVRRRGLRTWGWFPWNPARFGQPVTHVRPRRVRRGNAKENPASANSAKPARTNRLPMKGKAGLPRALDADGYCCS
jgi:hypothetical protein